MSTEQVQQGDSEQEYLTAQEVGHMVRVSEKTVYRWAQDDPTFPVTRIGGVVRFHRERIRRWLRDREQGRPRKSEEANDQR